MHNANEVLGIGIQGFMELQCTSSSSSKSCNIILPRNEQLTYQSNKQIIYITNPKAIFMESSYPARIEQKQTMNNKFHFQISHSLLNYFHGFKFQNNQLSETYIMHSMIQRNERVENLLNLQGSGDSVMIRCQMLETVVASSFK